MSCGILSLLTLLLVINNLHSIFCNHTFYMHTHSTAVEFFSSFEALQSGQSHSALDAALLVYVPQVAVCLR